MAIQEPADTEIPDHLIEKAEYFRLITISVSGIVVMNTATNFLHGHFFLVWLNLICFLLLNFSYFYLFRIRHFFLVGRMVALISCNLVVFFAAATTGSKLWNEGYLLVGSILSLLIFHQKERMWSLALVFLNGAGYLALIQFPEPLIHLEEPPWTSADVLENQIAFILIFILCLYSLSKSHDRATGLFQTQKNMWKALAEGSVAGIFKMNSEGKVIYANLTFFKMFPMCILGSSDFLKMLPAEVGPLFEIWKQESSEAPFTSEVSLLGFGSQHLPVRIYLKSSLDELNQSLEFVGAVLDLTQQKSLEMKLVESSKMAALGELGAGVAHEINNPLAIIVGQVEILKRRIAANTATFEELTEGLNKIGGVAFRISRIIKGLRAFAREASHDSFEKVEFQKILSDALGLCQAYLRDRSIDLKLPDPLTQKNVAILCRPTQVSQVLVNLISNSAEAINHLPEKWIGIAVHQNTDLVWIDFSDSGAGIAEEVANKIMQPFFTTKPVGKGVGLGLSISQGIMQSHGGKLELLKGLPHTTFRLTFPRG